MKLGRDDTVTIRSQDAHEAFGLPELGAPISVTLLVPTTRYTHMGDSPKGLPRAEVLEGKLAAVISKTDGAAAILALILRDVPLSNGGNVTVPWHAIAYVQAGGS